MKPGQSAERRARSRSRYVARSAALLTCAVIQLFATPRVMGVSYYLATDVPVTLNGIDYTPNQVLISNSGLYALELPLPPGTALAALHRRVDGRWLFTVDNAVSLSGVEYEPRDIVAYDGVAFAMFLDGETAGIPVGIRVDALFLDAGGNLVLSFDTPSLISGVEYTRSDLVRFAGGATTLWWSSEAAGVPAYANVVGADLDTAGMLVVTFDVPATLGGVDYLPGQLVGWTGAAFISYFQDAGWPPSAELRDFSLVPAAGAVPDGSAATAPLTVRQAVQGALSLTWGSSCVPGDTDYEIYEGRIGEYYSHTVKQCATGGSMAATITPGSGSTYYLVVPRNSLREGSYGRHSNGSERPQGASACLSQEIVQSACP